MWIRRDGVCLFHAKCREKGIEPPVPCEDILQACHKITTTKWGIKFDERNVFCGCKTSNGWAHWNQPEWDILWRKLWPEDMDYLEAHKNDSAKYGAWWYKVEIDRLKTLLKKYQGSHP